MENDIFDWGQLPSDWWLQTAREIGADERHAKFAAAKFRNCSNTEAARLSGFGTGGAESTRSEGYRVARSNKVNSLLALAAAEAGGGPDGTLTKSEARGILTAMARGSDPQIRIKSIELLSKMDREEQERNEPAEETDYAQELYLLASALPQSGLGAVFGLSHYFQTAGHIIGFPYIKEVAPIASQRFTDDWRRWCSKHNPDEIAQLDKLAAGPLLDGDDLVSAIKAKQPKHVAIPKIEEALSVN